MNIIRYLGVASNGIIGPHLGTVLGGWGDKIHTGGACGQRRALETHTHAAMRLRSPQDRPKWTWYIYINIYFFFFCYFFGWSPTLSRIHFVQCCADRVSRLVIMWSWKWRTEKWRRIHCEMTFNMQFSVYLNVTTCPYYCATKGKITRVYV